MRILIAIDNRFLMGGAEHHLRSLIPGLQRRGHEISLVYENSGEPTARKIDEGLEGLRSWCAANGREKELLAQLDSWRPDVVYVHGLSSFRFESLLLDHYPGVLFAHNYYGTCISGNKFSELPTPHCCTRRFGLACLAIYLPSKCGGRNPLTMLKNYRQQQLRHAALSRYRLVLVASRHMQAEFIRNGVESQRVRLVPLFPADLFPNAHLHLLKGGPAFG